MCEYVYRDKTVCNMARTQELAGKQYCTTHRKAVTKKVRAKEENALKLKEFVGGEESIRKVKGSRGERVNKSVFMCTLNTNKKIDSLSDEYKQKLRVLIDYLFNFTSPDNGGHECIYSFVVDCKTGGIVNDNVVLNRRTDYALEVGDEQHRLHLHFTVELDHKTCAQINTKDFRTFANKWLGSTIHFNVQVIKKPTSYLWEQYINKNMDLLGASDAVDNSSG